MYTQQHSKTNTPSHPYPEIKARLFLLIPLIKTGIILLCNFQCTFILRFWFKLHLFFSLVKQYCFSQWNSVFSPNETVSFFPVKQYFFSPIKQYCFFQWNSIVFPNGTVLFFPMKQYCFSQWNRIFFFSPIKQYYFPQWNSIVFPRETVFFPPVKQCMLIKMLSTTNNLKHSQTDHGVCLSFLSNRLLVPMFPQSGHLTGVSLRQCLWQQAIRAEYNRVLSA